MSNVITIDLQLKGVQQVTQGMQRAAKSMNAFGASQSTAAKNITATGNAAKGAIGPMQRYQQSLQKLAAIQGKGSQAQIFDAQYRVYQASKGANRAWNQMFRPNLAGGGSGSSNIGPIARAMGLGQVGTVIAEGLTSPLGLATAALVGFSQAVKVGSAAISAYNATRYGLGATPQEAAAMNKISAAVPGADASAAVDILNRLKAGGVGPNMVGLHPMPGPYGEIDAAKYYIETAKRIRGMSYDQAQRASIVLGHPELMNFRNMDQRQFNDLIKGGFAADQNTINLQQAADNIRSGASSTIGKIGAGVTSGWNQFLVNLDNIFGGKYPTGVAAQNMAGPVPIGAAPESQKADKLNKSVDKLTDALNRNTDVIVGKTASSAGGGERAAHMPVAAESYQFYVKELRRQNLAIGGFGL